MENDRQVGWDSVSDVCRPKGLARLPLEFHQDKLRRLGASALVVAILLSFATVIPVTAQEPKFSDFHTWSDIATIYNFNDRFRYDGDYGLRGLLTDDYWTLLYLRPSVRYRNPSWLSLHGGAALFYNFFNGEADLPELRPWVGARFVWPRLGGFDFSHYFRLELRAFYIDEEAQWNSYFRGRYQLAMTSPDFAIGTADAFYILLSAEAFEDMATSDSTTFGDRFRFNLGIGKKVTSALRMELNYVFHTLRLSDARGDFDFDDHVVRLRLFYSFN